HLELNDFVEAELLRNPLLEREDGGEPDAPEPEPVERSPELSAYEDTVDRGERIHDANSIADGYDTAVENVFPDQGGQDQLNPQSRLDRNGVSEAGDAPDIDQFVASRPLLSDHLENQANLILRTQADRLIARHLIDGLNEAGYLTIELPALAEQLGAELADIEAVLGALQAW